MKRLIILLFIGFSLLSCDDFLEIGPNVSELDAQLVFEKDKTALGALEALYHELQFSGFASGNASSITFLSNILTDDAEEHNITHNRFDFYANGIRPDNGTNSTIWSSTYNQLYNANTLLEKIDNNIKLTEETKKRIEGETKFIRAFIYYYLVHFYGEISLVLTTDYKENMALPGVSIKEIYTQIKKDLTEVIGILPEDYQYADGEHIRPTKYTAYTLLARMALWQKEYDRAIDYSSQVINSEVYELTTLDKVFVANSKESIWQLVPINPTIGASEGSVYILENNPATPNVAATLSLTDDFLSIWEAEDLRAEHWINVYSEGDNHYYYPYKYKIKSGGDTEEYSMVMRLAELYLIRAEAYAMSNKPEKALDDLNTIRNRAGLADWPIADVPDIKEAVLEERRRELFSEWGHRWLDLKRFGKLDEVLGAKKSTWDSHAQLLPIPEQDLLRNPFLTQNPGY